MTIRSWLYCPGNAPGRIVNAHVYGADGIVLDLEDSVAPQHKDEARFLVAEALSDFFPRLGGDAAQDLPTVAVRVNGLTTAWWRDDVVAAVSAGTRTIRIPKVESADEVNRVCEALEKVESAHGGVPGLVRLQCILETPKGIEAAFQIAVASPRVESLSFGAEDYCAATGIDRAGPEWALDYPRSRIVSAAASAGLTACDTVWANFRDQDALSRDAQRARDLGMDAKSAIHPDQITVINKIFSPTEGQIAWAQRIVSAAENTAGTAGATAVDGAMVDVPVLTRAHRILSRSQNDGS